MSVHENSISTWWVMMECPQTVYLYCGWFFFNTMICISIWLSPMQFSWLSQSWRTPHAASNPSNLHHVGMTWCSMEVLAPKLSKFSILPIFQLKSCISINSCTFTNKKPCGLVGLQVARIPSIIVYLLISIYCTRLHCTGSSAPSD